MNSQALPIAYRRPAPPTLLLVRELAAERESNSQAPAEPAVEPEAAADWTRVHERLTSLGKDRAAHERDVCRWLLAARRLGAHARAGFASLAEYAERLVGLSGRQTEERLRVGQALAELPALDRALASGELRWSAVRELTRVAKPETEAAWVAWASARRLRQIEQAVAARRPGDGPRDRADPSLVRHRISFQVRAETLALVRDLQARVRADHGSELDDDALLYEIARRALGGPTDEGRASYQIAVTRCDECGRASIDAGGESHPVDDVVAEMAACDAQEVGTGPHVGVQRERASQAIPPATRRAVMRRDHMRCVVPGCRNHRFLDVHHLDPRSEGGGHDPERLACLCGSHHRAVHAGTVQIDGTGSAGFVVRHGDGTPYGAPVSPVAVEMVRQALGALQKLGFKSTHARALVDEAMRAGAPGNLPGLLRAALQGARA